MNNEQVILQRDCDAVLIPTAVPISIPSGTLVTIVQTLGGTFTVHISGNLARVDAKDADALGKEADQAGPEFTQVDATGPVEEHLVWDQLRTCFDPEIPVNIVDLGLIYDVQITASDDKKKNKVDVEMTLTAAGCGMGPIIANDAEMKIRAIENVTDVQIDVVFDPPWDQSMMTDAAKLELGML